MLWAFVQIYEISSQEHVSEWISHPLFYGDQGIKLMMVKGAANFILSGSKKG